MTLKERIITAYGTQKAFAKAVGVDERTVKRWVKADSIPQGTDKAFKARAELKRALRSALSELF